LLNNKKVMSNTYKHKTLGRLRAGLSINKKEELYVRKISNRHNFFDDIEKENHIKYKTRSIMKDLTEE
jgi:hypothetical protein